MLTILKNPIMLDILESFTGLILTCYTKLVNLISIHEVSIEVCLRCKNGVIPHPGASGRDLPSLQRHGMPDPGLA